MQEPERAKMRPSELTCRSVTVAMVTPIHTRTREPLTGLLTGRLNHKVCIMTVHGVDRILAHCFRKSA